MLDKETRHCPQCSFPAKGKQVGNDPNWKKFQCEPCEEEWYEDTKYCLAKFQFPTEIVN